MKCFKAAQVAIVALAAVLISVLAISQNAKSVQAKSAQRGRQDPDLRYLLIKAQDELQTLPAVD